MIRPKLWQILQNLLRIVATAGIPSFIAWQAGLFDLAEKPIPPWIWVVIGAFIGGFISTPANNIGNLVWEILTIWLSIRTPPKGDKEGPRILREIRHENWIRDLESTSVVKLTLKYWKRWMLPAAYFVVPIYGLIVLLSVLDKAGYAFPITMLGSAIIEWATLTTVLALASSLWVKSFFHQK